MWNDSFFFIAVSSSVKIYHLLSHIFRTESVKYNENYTRAVKRPEVIIQIIWTDEVRNIWASHPFLPSLASLLIPWSQKATDASWDHEVYVPGTCGYTQAPNIVFFGGYALLLALKSGLKH